MEANIKVSVKFARPQVAVTVVDELVAETGRRRAGRLTSVNPSLLPLLRKSERDQLPILAGSSAAASGNDAAILTDVAMPELAVLPFQQFESSAVWFGEGEGTALGVLLGTIIWAALATAVWVILKWLL